MHSASDGTVSLCRPESLRHEAIHLLYWASLGACFFLWRRCAPVGWLCLYTVFFVAWLCPFLSPLGPLDWGGRAFGPTGLRPWQEPNGEATASKAEAGAKRGGDCLQGRHALPLLPLLPRPHPPRRPGGPETRARQRQPRFGAEAAANPLRLRRGQERALAAEQSSPAARRRDGAHPSSSPVPGTPRRRSTPCG